MITETQRDALNRLTEIAQGDTGQRQIVADFLLAWWNADESGGFNLTHVWAVDGAIVDDMAHVFRIIRDTSSYPDQLGYKEDFQAILRQWRRALPCNASVMPSKRGTMPGNLEPIEYRGCHGSSVRRHQKVGKSGEAGSNCEIIKSGLYERSLAQLVNSGCELRLLDRRATRREG